MPKLATGANSPHSRPARVTPGPRGFTLVEVLVVVIIAGIITATALLVVGQSGPAQTNERELARLGVSLEVMCDQALLSGNARGLRFHPEGYDFWRHQAGSWLPVPPDSRPRPVRWPDGIRPRVELDNRLLRPALSQRLPQVICTGIEPPTPFVIELGGGEHRRRMSWPK